MAKKILVVDDDPEFINAVTNLLESKGYTVVSALNGKEGLKKAKSVSPDLIFLDVMMTEKSEGFDVARSIKADAETKGIPVVLITGIRKDMNLPFGFEADEDWLPVKTVLEKPVKPDTILKTVEEYIGK